MNKMKTYLFIFLLLSPLWVFSSCQDDEDKLPGSKLEILIGKWENVGNLYADFLGYLKIGKRYTTYEFTNTGGSITQLDYIAEEDRYEEPYIRYFTDWSYEGETIHFLRKKGRSTEKWDIYIYNLTQDSIGLGSTDYIYYKISNK
jgi:hypothetical protein